MGVEVAAKPQDVGLPAKELDLGFSVTDQSTGSTVWSITMSRWTATKQLPLQSLERSTTAYGFMSVSAVFPVRQFATLPDPFYGPPGTDMGHPLGTDVRSCGSTWSIGPTVSMIRARAAFDEWKP